MSDQDFNFSLLWDAGEMGCGELIMELARKIKKLNKGDYIKVVALDKGGIEDLPAWARLTKNDLVLFDPPVYIFKKNN